MRYLILSDIHANWEALAAVVEAAAGKYDRIACCGDLVGYGADTNAVLDWARANLSLAVRGNHDKACAGSEDLEWFNPVARASALWTQRELSAENLEYLRSLPRGPVALNGFQLLHGSPLDEDEYLINSHDVGQVAGYVAEPLSFFGHTHLQGGFLLHRSGVLKLGRPTCVEEERVLELEPDAVYMLNGGSVGQPRDGDARAAYLLFDSGERLATFSRARYDVASAQAKIRRAGLPPLLADRLERGA